MLHMISRSSFCSKYHPLHQAGCIKTLQLPSTQIHCVTNRSPCKKYSIKCPQSSINITNNVRNREDISSRNCKQFNKYRCFLTLQDGYEPKHLYNNYSTSFRDVFFKNLISFYRLTRPYTWTGTVIAITSVSFLPIQNLADLTPTFFMGILKALVPAVLMNIYVVTLNQLYDVEIDKVNKPDLPLASGDFSRGTGIAIALISSLTSLTMGVMSRSPPLLLALIIWFLLGSAYSIQLPFLRWKGHPFLAPFSMMILMGLVYQLLFFIHIQKYMLARPVVITKPLVFATAFMCVLSFANGLLKDVPDVDGDRKFDIQTLSVIVGRERVFWFCVYMMLTAYGAAILVGASSSFPLSKLVTHTCFHSVASS
ncbi:homogentisate phytyltransferase 1 [Citrus sinensis]|uniref:Homogentisate phytyltransferase 1 n=2 Tax=Citrus sinensis TaxID=2711 RepID=A0ACB8JDM1_CITSI|nr:homogentisate phytyltransferase 1 [Citrus sinensis]KAH9715688.1 homogentisate phytyltransferase 1 [Citrus sinensis]